MGREGRRGGEEVELAWPYCAFLLLNRELSRSTELREVDRRQEQWQVGQFVQSSLP